MYKSILVTAGLLVGVFSNASAAELKYRWKKGDLHRFSFESDNKIEMKLGGAMGNMMGGMMGGSKSGAGINARMKTKTVFTQKVKSVASNGTAQIDFTVERLDMFQGGRKVASIDKIPPKARKVRAEVDEKGRAKFYKMVTVYMKDNQVYLGVHKAQVGPNGASASARAGDTSVEIVASVDPRTGKISAQMKVTEHKPKLKKVSIKKEDPSVDILPKEILKMMQLPEGSIPSSGTQEIKMPFGTVAVDVVSWKGKKVHYKTKFGVSAAANVPESDEAADEDDPGMGMPSLGGMMGGMGAGAPAGGSAKKSKGASMGMKLNGDVSVHFDNGRGRLTSMKGNITNSMSMGGMGEMKTDSQFELKRIK
jgi:hypothetical protein